jgi:MFS family permease
LAGVLADRFDRRLLMILGDGFSALGLVYILLCMMTGRIHEWQVCLGVGTSSCFVALLEPSYKATITDLLTKEQFAKASGLVQTAGSAKFLLSPLIAGFLLTITDIRTILIIDISTIAVTLPITMFVKNQIVSNRIASPKTGRGKQGFFRELTEGWRTIAALSQFGYAAAYAVSGVLADQVFNPLLRKNGALASSIGRIIGVGERRGIALMLVVSGALLVVAAVIMGKIPSIRALEEALTI